MPRIDLCWGKGQVVPLSSAFQALIKGISLGRSSWCLWDLRCTDPTGIRERGCSPPVQVASLQRVSYYRHLPFMENLHGKRGKNTQLANQNVIPNGKIPLDLITGHVGLEGM